jgi:hypothetical protein
MAQTYVEQLEAAADAAAKQRGNPAWTAEEYAEITKWRNAEYAVEAAERRQENFAVLAAVDLLHPDLTPFEVGMFHLAGTVWEEPTLLAAVTARYGPLAVGEHGYETESYTAAAYEEAFKELPRAEQQAMRERILALPGWQQWAATKK